MGWVSLHSANRTLVVLKGPGGPKSSATCKPGPRRRNLHVTQLPPNFRPTLCTRLAKLQFNFKQCNSPKTEFLLIGLTKQLAKINNSSLTTTHSARNLGFIFDEHLTFSDQISSVSKSCYYHIRQLRCIRPYLDTKTASTIATSTVHPKLV